MGKKDINLLAKFITDIATGEIEQPKSKKEGQRLGGIKGGASRAKSLTAKKRSEIAIKAAKSRWGK